ncbi:MAG: alpha/beta hydrolase [Tissierellia bacterium]|nr:alpha/beta hydrolase [Tissierellia bacterium]
MPIKNTVNREHFLTSDGVCISYNLKGEGTALVFVHGWSGSQEDFAGSARRLAKKYKTLTYDQRGHGLSDRPLSGYNLKRLVRDLFELICELELEKLVLIGHSMGGAVLLEYLKTFGPKGVAAIVLVDMSPKLINDENWDLGLYNGTYKEENFKEDILSMKEDFQAHSFNFLKNMLPGLKDEKLRALIALRNKVVAPGYEPGLIMLWEDMALMDYRRDLEDIEIPVAVFRGEFSFHSEDCALYMKSKLERGSIVEFKGCTHQLILENPRGFEREVENFIDKEGLGRNNG